MNRNILLIIGSIVIVILLIPFLAMQFTDEVNWTISDFIVAASLLIGTGLLIELVLRKIKNVNYRVLVSVIIILLLALIWAELAVGIIDTPLSGN